MLGLKLFTFFPLQSCQFLKLYFNTTTTQICQKFLLFLQNIFRSLCYYQWHFAQSHLLLQVLHLKLICSYSITFQRKRTVGLYVPKLPFVKLALPAVWVLTFKPPSLLKTYSHQPFSAEMLVVFKMILINRLCCALYISCRLRLM